MNVKCAWFVSLNIFLGLALLILASAGCSTTDYSAAMAVPNLETNLTIPRLNLGDKVTISFSGLPEGGDSPLPSEVEKPIKEDGTITLPLIDRVQAAGKTAGELEDAIHNAYVPAYFTHLNVTVKTTSDLVYFVRGEVKNPGRLVYVGSITVTKAITSAGDFTDFANHHKVYLIRADGHRFKLDCDRILSGDRPDPPVFPGDQIEVRRRTW